MTALVGYLAPEGFLPQLLRELDGRVRQVHGRLVLANADVTVDAEPEAPDTAAVQVAWAANVWLEPRQLTVSSIGDAARQLRALQRNWALYPGALHRRAALIASRLPAFSARPLPFGTPAPAAPLGSWTLLAPGELLASARCSSPFVHGEARFVEDRAAPPNRAYLKLWEAFTRLGLRPAAGEVCLDLGASPGGWTWVLASLGARVISVDKAPLSPQVARLPGVTPRQESAFGLDPHAVGPVDWLLSDVVCYPARLLRLVQRWLAAGTARRFICTVKFQGETDFAAMDGFKVIAGSRLVHLHHNKHELTWIKV